MFIGVSLPVVELFQITNEMIFSKGHSILNCLSIIVKYSGQYYEPRPRLEHPTQFVSMIVLK